MASFREMISGTDVVVAPFVFNPMSAQLAEQAGFEALYLGGGGLGYLQSITEANLTLPEMTRVATDIRTVCRLPLILDGACGWGDPMHLHRTIPMAEAAGFCAIEIEDQILPKRVHHHIDLERIYPMQMMVDKVREAVAARTDPDFVIIARTNAARTDNLDEALRRCEAYYEAGADLLLSLGPTDIDKLRVLGERMPGPWVHMLEPGLSLPQTGVSLDDLAGLGARLLVNGVTPVLVIHSTLKRSYQAMAKNEPDPFLGPDWRAEIDAIHDTIGLEKLLEVERRTTEKP